VAMKVFKVIFAKNEVMACSQVTINLECDYNYEHDKGQLIYALIKAENETDAVCKSYQIVKELNEKIFGKDFVN
jgi:hypothetical protein